MEYIKSLHVAFAVLTGLSFFIRGVWMIAETPLLQKTVTRIVPHLIDTVLLGTALLLAFDRQLNPFDHPWLLAKITALAAYIGCGLMAFRYGKTKNQKTGFWLLALGILFCIYGFALTKRVIFF